MNLELQLRNILQQVLNHNTDHFIETTPLLGEYPELDSMGLMSLLIAIENDIKIEQDNIDLTAETFATFGSLLRSLTQTRSLAERGHN